MLKKQMIFFGLLSCMFFLSSCGEIVEVENAIAQIGSVSMDSLERLENAEILYDALPEKKREKVDNYYMLYSARADYDRMVLRIQEGINVISRIGEISKDNLDMLTLARQVYNELETEGLARYVSNDYLLLEAENQYMELLLEEAGQLLNSQKYQEAYDAYLYILSNFEDNQKRENARHGACNALTGMAEKLYHSGKLDESIQLLQRISSDYGKTEESEALLLKVEKQLEKQRPNSGKIFKNSVGWGYNEFIVAASDQDACVKLENLADPSKYILFYVRKGEQETVKVQDGVYAVKYTTGKYWFGQERMFGADASFVKADETMEFTTTKQGSTVSYSIIEITLYQVVGGNMSTSMIGAEAF